MGAVASQGIGSGDTGISILLLNETSRSRLSTTARTTWRESSSWKRQVHRARGSRRPPRETRSADSVQLVHPCASHSRDPGASTAQSVERKAGARVPHLVADVLRVLAGHDEQARIHSLRAA
jgi:hypothetical protein